MALPVYSSYPSDLNAAEWAMLAPLIANAKLGSRPRSVDIRRIVNGIFDVLRTGCARACTAHTTLKRTQQSYLHAASSTVRQRLEREGWRGTEESSEEA